uniref:Uncharacterized protein n=1 Tax=Nothobranchius rachovii TaxID=451742 RepID=A0A1A8SB51_9TELE
MVTKTKMTLADLQWFSADNTKFTDTRTFVPHRPHLPATRKVLDSNTRWLLFHALLLTANDPNYTGSSFCALRMQEWLAQEESGDVKTSEGEGHLAITSRGSLKSPVQQL